VNGTVEVQGWDRDVVEVHAVKTAKLKESTWSASPSTSMPVEEESIATRYPQNEGVE